MRLTRAAQRAQQDVEEHVEASEANNRALKDIEPNTSPAAHVDEPLPAKTPAKTPAKKGKGKAGKRAAKSKKTKTEEEQAHDNEEAEVQGAAEGESTEQEPGLRYTDDPAEDIKNEEQPVAPQTPAVRLTRRQMAKLEEEEALSKSQHTIHAPDADTAENVAEQAAGRPDVATQEVDDGAPETETSDMQEEPTVEPQPARKPTRMTQRQQTKPEDEETDEPAQELVEVENSTGNITAESELSIKSKKAIEQRSASTATEKSTEVEPEVDSKPKRLTRRQQAKLEEEQQQSQVERQIPSRSQNSVEELATEAQDEAVDEQEKSEKPGDEVRTVEEPAAPTTAADEHLNVGEKLETEPQQVVEVEVEPELLGAEIVQNQVSTTIGENEDVNDMVGARPATPSDAEFEADFDLNVADEAMLSVDITTEAEPKMLCEEKPFETSTSTSTPTKIQDPMRRTSRSPSKSPMRIEESISAIDRLEEDLESIGTAIPDLDHSDDERTPRKSTKSTLSTATQGKTPSKTPAKTPAPASAQIPAKSTSKTSSRTPARAPVVAKAPIASKPQVAAKASLPRTISRVPSAAPKSVKPTTTSLARASSVRTAPSKDVRKPSTETADYLASKRRPISLSFPTPPPPPKGRAPTKSTFQLSSENVAAKLRAQKEERLKREAEGTAAPKQRPISMPPPPKSTKPPTVPSFQLPGEATAARLKAQKEERLRRMEEAGGAEKPAARPISMPPPPKSTKPPTKPTFQLPGEATAARLKAQKEERLKRMEEAEAAKKAASAAAARKPIVHRPRQSLLIKDTPGVSIPPPSQAQPDASARSTSSLASKRNSLAGPASRSTSTSSAARHSVLLSEGGKSTLTPLDAAALKNKGRQVFNRDKVEKEAVERERREKEEAAKRARAEAAERGRIASREWAERQRKKMMMGQ